MLPKVVLVRLPPFAAGRRTRRQTARRIPAAFIDRTLPATFSMLPPASTNIDVEQRDTISVAQLMTS
jgi:hypothetical protein